LEWKTGYRVERVTVDHLDADKLHNKPENLVSACDECNRQRTSSKGLRLELEWQPVGRVQGARWRKLQQEVLAEHPICQSAGCKNPASDVDHIVARRFGGDVWDRANLQALCKPCHGRKTSRENRRR
jgi:5-methylcytosine-specific restriction endonuclease McrA